MVVLGDLNEHWQKATSVWQAENLETRAAKRILSRIGSRIGTTNGKS